VKKVSLIQTLIHTLRLFNKNKFILLLKSHPRISPKNTIATVIKEKQCYLVVLRRQIKKAAIRSKTFRY